MKYLIALFLSLSLTVQAEYLIDVGISKNMDLFDWAVFLDEEHIEDLIDERNWLYSLYGPNFLIISDLNIAKSDLLKLEKELGLYKQGIKRGLSEEQIEKAEEAIRRHWENIKNIEMQFQYRAGLELGEGFEALYTREKYLLDVKGFNEGMWDLYDKDHKILFNLVEKMDENLYQNVLKGDDEAYAQLILPQVEKYTEKMQGITRSYYNSLLSIYEEQIPFYKMENIKIGHLLNISEDSSTIYNCFLKNFENPTGEYQKKLKSVIEAWYGEQSYLGASSLIEAYNAYGYGANPSAIAYSLNDFRYAPIELREEIAAFYRREFIHNEEFINTDDSWSLGARVNALIGLKYFGLINEEELELFNRAIEQGVIEPRKNSYLGHHDPIK